jgi:NAD(P)-dependent dehydrogenase (short-subunit alcohol dehydrogenase family)
VVTGVSSGIGAETARVLRQHGARVVGVDRQDAGITLEGFVRADLGSLQGVAQAVSALPERIDGLCNVAGVPGTAPVEAVATINYLGVRELTERLLPRIGAGGSIVNVASILGGEYLARLDQHKALAAVSGFERGQRWLREHPVAQQTCYQYFKEALIVWTMAQALPWFLQHDVRMNSVAPGPVMTPILGDFVTMLGQERVQADAKHFKRPALADEIAPVIAFLCADESRWIAGANLPVDAGLAGLYLTR